MKFYSYRLWTAVFFCSVTALSVNAYAATQGANMTSNESTASSTASAINAQDQKFLEDAAHAGALEIQASKLAEHKAKSDDVRKFAERMIDDHQQVAQQLQTLAREKRTEVSDEPSAEQKEKLKMLETQSDQFDQTYVKEIAIAAHEKAVALFEHASRDARDSDIKAFAKKVLHKLEQHLSLGRDLQEKIKDKGKPAQ